MFADEYLLPEKVLFLDFFLLFQTYRTIYSSKTGCQMTSESFYEK